MSPFKTGIPKSIQAATLLLTSCHQGTALSQSQTSRDKAILEARSWRESTLDFIDKSDDLEDVNAVAGGARLAGIGPFQLGMTPGEVRTVARAHHFKNSGVPNSAWCLPPHRGVDEPAIIRTPAYITYDNQYTIDFDAFGSQLRASRIELDQDGSRGKIVELTDPQKLDLLKKSGESRLRECDLTGAEYDNVSAFYEFQNSPLQYKFSNAIYLKSSIPGKIQKTLDGWEEEIYVPLPSPCCDRYDRSAHFNGAWNVGQYIVASYDIYENGEAASTTPYVLVVGQDGVIVWAGDPEEFAARGLKGKQRPLARIG